MEVADSSNQLSPDVDETQNPENTMFIKQENYEDDYDSLTSYKCNDGTIVKREDLSDCHNSISDPLDNYIRVDTEMDVDELRNNLIDASNSENSNTKADDSGKNQKDENELEISEEQNIMPEYKSWTTNSTKRLIHFYKKYRNTVGTAKLKSMKKLWELIAQEINKIMPNMNVSAANCENRWRVLERSYRKVIDNKNKTGRGRRTFEFAKEFEEIFGKKRRVHPSVVLLSPTHAGTTHRTSGTPTQYRFVTLDSQGNVNKSITCTPSNESTKPDNAAPSNVIKHTEGPSTSSSAIRFVIAAQTQGKSTSTQHSTPTTEKQTGVKFLRRDVLDKIRKDRLQYYKQRENISERKLALEEKKINIIERELKVRNELYRERNNIFQQFLERNIHINLRSE